MGANLVQIDTATDTWFDFLEKTNQVIYLMRDNVIDATQTLAHGNAALIGSMASNTVYAKYLSGGTFTTSGDPSPVGGNLTFTSNVSFTGYRTKLGLPANVVMTPNHPVRTLVIVSGANTVNSSILSIATDTSDMKPGMQTDGTVVQYNNYSVGVDAFFDVNYAILNTVIADNFVNNAPFTIPLELDAGGTAIANSFLLDHGTSDTISGNSESIAVSDPVGNEGIVSNSSINYTDGISQYASFDVNQAYVSSATAAANLQVSQLVVYDSDTTNGVNFIANTGSSALSGADTRLHYFNYSPTSSSLTRGFEYYNESLFIHDDVVSADYGLVRLEPIAGPGTNYILGFDGGALNNTAINSVITPNEIDLTDNNISLEHYISNELSAIYDNASGSKSRTISYANVIITETGVNTLMVTPDGAFTGYTSSGSDYFSINSQGNITVASSTANAAISQFGVTFYDNSIGLLGALNQTGAAFQSAFQTFGFSGAGDANVYASNSTYSVVINPSNFGINYDTGSGYQGFSGNAYTMQSYTPSSNLVANSSGFYINSVDATNQIPDSLQPYYYEWIYG